MYYGVEQSTDFRDRQTIIKKFGNKNVLLNWMKISGNFTHDDPESVRNWHHTFRYGYQYFGRIDKKDPIFKDFGTHTYPNSYNDQVATYLYKYGEEVKNG